jgi:hypothetical protein
LRWLKWVAVAVLLATGVLGIKDGAGDWGNPQTALQRTVTVGVLLYGVLGLVAAFGVVRRQRWSAVLSAAWGVVVTYVATVASFAYSDPTLSQSGTMAGVMGAFVATALIGLFVVWVVRRTLRAAPPTQPVA